MTDLAVSRRAVTRALAFLPAASIAPAAFAVLPAATASNPDASIVAAHNQRIAFRRSYNALPEGAPEDYGADGYTDAERSHWEIMDAAEEVIVATTARTPRGVAIQLWTALENCLCNREDCEAAYREDLDYFSDPSNWSPQVRPILAALRSAHAMEA